MQADVAEKEIDGFTYKVGMLDPLVATDLLTDIGQILAPVLGAMGGVIAKEKGDNLKKLFDGFEDGDDTNIDVAIERAVIGFFTRFDKAKQRELIGILTKVTTVVVADGKEPQLKDIFALHFRGRVLSLYKWFGFALKVQFGDFFSGTGLDIAQFARKLAAVSGSLTT